MRILTFLLNLLITFCCSSTFVFAEQTRTSLESELQQALEYKPDVKDSVAQKEVLLANLDKKIAKAERRNWSEKKFHRVYSRKISKGHDRLSRVANQLDNEAVITKMYLKALEKDSGVKREEIAERLKDLHDSKKVEENKQIEIDHVKTFRSEAELLRSMKVEVEKEDVSTAQVKKIQTRLPAANVLKILLIIFVVGLLVGLAYIIFLIATGAWVTLAIVVGCLIFTVVYGRIVDRV